MWLSNLAIAIHKSQPTETNAKLSSKGKKKKISIRAVFYISVNVFNTKYVADCCRGCICGQWHWKQNNAHETDSRADTYNNFCHTFIFLTDKYCVIQTDLSYYFKINFIWQIARVHVWYTKKKKASLLLYIFFCAGMLRKILSFPQAVFLASFQAPIWYRSQIRNMSLPICNQLKTGISLDPEDKGKTQ
jgi:hypothetical protein